MDRVDLQRVRQAVSHDPTVILPSQDVLVLLDVIDAKDKDIADITDVLCKALPFVEDSEGDKAYKPGVVTKLVKQIRNIIEGGN